MRELSRRRTLIRHDERGCGLSDRELEATPTLDTYVGDLAAVVEAAGLERFALLGVSGGGPTAIEYAARNPGRVSRLVLYGSYSRGRYLRGTEAADQSRVLIELMRVGWGGSVPAFRQAFSSMYIPTAGEEQKRWYDEMRQASSTGEIAALRWRSRSHTDITHTARLIDHPALVLHARHDRVIPYEDGRRLASLPPNARFVTLETDNHILQEREPAWELFLAAVRAFLGEDERTPAPAADFAELSDRELEVLELVAAGMSNEQIAERLFLSTRTVRAPPLERLRQAAAVGQVRARRRRCAILAYLTGAGGPADENASPHVSANRRAYVSRWPRTRRARESATERCPLVSASPHATTATAHARSRNCPIPACSATSGARNRADVVPMRRTQGVRPSSAFVRCPTRERAPARRGGFRPRKRALLPGSPGCSSLPRDALHG